MRCDTVSIFCYRRAPLQDCVLELLVCLATAQEPPQLGFLHLLLQYQVLKDTLPLARTLLNLSCDWLPGMQLGLDMLHRLEDWDGLASGLLRSGRVLEACRVCDTRDLSPNRFEFLRAASAESNEVFYEVYYILTRKLGQGFWYNGYNFDYFAQHALRLAKHVEIKNKITKWT